jgi:ABC-type dipeptide/oligopeptide/nickel transport system permease component
VSFLVLFALPGDAVDTKFGGEATAGSPDRWYSRLPLNLPPLGVAVPSFLVGLPLLELFSFRLYWFAAIGNEGIGSIVLPAITPAIPTGAVVAQLLAKSLHQTMSQPYADTARVKGASEPRVLRRHAVRNAVIPALTISGVLVGQLLSGAVVTETVFSRTGLGRRTATAVSGQDIPVVQGIVGAAAARPAQFDRTLAGARDPGTGHRDSRRVFLEFPRLRCGAARPGMGVTGRRPP